MSDRVIATQITSDRVIATQVMSDRVIATQVMSDRVIATQVMSDRVIATQNMSGEGVTSGGEWSTHHRLCEWPCKPLLFSFSCPQLLILQTLTSARSRPMTATVQASFASTPRGGTSARTRRRGARGPAPPGTSTTATARRAKVL